MAVSRLFKRLEPSATSSTPNIETASSQERPDNKAQALHNESFEHPKHATQWKLSKTGDGDTAMALFDRPDSLEEPIDPAEEKKLIRRIDLMIIPYLAVCYAFFYIDKTTLSYAALFNINQDLSLSGTEYSWLSSMFYFGFLVWALPTNLMLQRFPVGKYLGFNIFMWGVFLMIQAACQNFAQLAVLRALSGAAEACSDPGFMLITGMWYKRREQPVRMGLWYTANGLGIAGGGLLGYGIGHIRGALPSWKYEFLIVGAICCAWGIVMFIFLPDSPVTAPGLSIRHRRVAVERLRSNQTGIENKHFKKYQLKEAFMDYKLYLLFLAGVVGNIPNGGISNFGTLIIQGFGFSTLVTTLMQVPYGAVIVLSILSFVFLNDRLGGNWRCIMIICSLMPNLAGAFGLRFVPTDQHVARLICYYLTGPYNAGFVLILSLSTANIAGHTKKVVTNAVLFLGYCTGNIAGPFFYKSEQAPTYSLGIWSMIVSHLIEIAVILLLRFLLQRENARRDRIQGVGKWAQEGGSHVDLDATAFGDLTDRENMNFRYIY